MNEINPIALLALCDLIAQATPYVVAFSVAAWLAWWIAPYLKGGNGE